MVTVTASESAAVGETDLLRNKSYRTADVDRMIEDIGVFIATLANFTSLIVKVGQDVVMDLTYADGTAPDPSKLRDVAIPVPRGSTLQALVTVATAATVTYLVMNIEDLE